jgi:hypothetical protein
MNERYAGGHGTIVFYFLSNIVDILSTTAMLNQ